MAVAFYGWGDWEELRALAAACAEAGDFEAASEYISRTIEIAPREREDELRREMERFKSRKGAAEGEQPKPRPGVH